MNAMFRSATSLCVFLLTSCTPSSSTLTVHTDYLSHENLASYYVNTPDPRLNNPPIGQRLVINWSVPKEVLKRDGLELHMRLRFRNKEEDVFSIPLSKSVGTYVYSLMDEEYFSKKGILTYKIELLAEKRLIQEWVHQIWTDLIVISPTTSLIEEGDEFNQDF